MKSHPYIKKKLDILRNQRLLSFFFFDASENWDFRRKKLLQIWRDRWIQRVTAKFCFSETEAYAAINWYEHKYNNFDELLEIKLSKYDSEKLLVDVDLEEAQFPVILLDSQGKYLGKGSLISNTRKTFLVTTAYSLAPCLTAVGKGPSSYSSPF